MHRVHIKTYGCQMNERDSEAVAALLRDRGYALVPSEREADVVLINTCSVRDLAEQKALSAMGVLAARKRKEPEFVLGFLGCMAQNRGAELLDRLPDLDLVIGTQKFHQVPDHLDRILGEHARRTGVPRPARVLDIGEEEGSQNTIREHIQPGSKPTAFVSIQQGCNMACTFCIVPKTRGDERSRPMEDIVEECRNLAAKGVREVTLLGQIVTSYGRKDYPHTGGRTPFTQLVEKVAEIDGIERIRFTSPHPRGFKDDLADAFRRIPKLMPHCHLPMQSGSDRLLRLMNRPYTRDAYLRIIDRLREAREDMHFSTDVIVGFPGETEEDFEQTLDLFRRVGFDMAYIFKYSIRTGTPAADMEDQCSEVEKEVRNRRLLEALEESSRSRVEAMVGRTYDVLIEGRSPDRPAKAGELPLPSGSVRLTGRTPGNRVTHLVAPEHRIGSIVPARIVRGTTSALYAEIA